jgi:hypothetical protein
VISIFALLLAASGPADAIQSASVQQRCAKSIYPSECERQGWAAFASSSALHACRVGSDKARKLEYKARKRFAGHPTQLEFETYCGDLVQACKTSWTAFYKRSAPSLFDGPEAKNRKDFERRLEQYCMSTLPEILVD